MLKPAQSSEPGKPNAELPQIDPSVFMMILNAGRAMGTYACQAVQMHRMALHACLSLSLTKTGIENNAELRNTQLSVRAGASHVMLQYSR